MEADDWIDAFYKSNQEAKEDEMKEWEDVATNKKTNSPQSSPKRTNVGLYYADEDDSSSITNDDDSSSISNDENSIKGGDVDDVNDNGNFKGPKKTTQSETPIRITKFQSNDSHVAALLKGQNKKKISGQDLGQEQERCGDQSAGNVDVSVASSSSDDEISSASDSDTNQLETSEFGASFDRREQREPQIKSPFGDVRVEKQVSSSNTDQADTIKHLEEEIRWRLS